MNGSHLVTDVYPNYLIYGPLKVFNLGPMLVCYRGIILHTLHLCFTFRNFIFAKCNDAGSDSYPDTPAKYTPLSKPLQRQYSELYISDNNGGLYPSYNKAIIYTCNKRACDSLFGYNYIYSPNHVK